MYGSHSLRSKMAVFCALLIGVFASWAGSAGAVESTLSPEVAVRKAQPGEKLTVIVELEGRADLGSIRIRDRDARQREVVERLRTRSESSRDRLRDLLARLRSTGEVERVVPLWISNSLAVTATPEAIRELAAHPVVSAVTPNGTAYRPVTAGAATTAAPEANLAAVSVPALWDLGITGRGVVVAGMDTGVDATHPDLAARWRGGTNSWFDPSGEHPDFPTDVSGHGTRTMGVMVGGSAGGTAIGAAPDARWISARIFNDRGVATTVGIHRSFQWLLDPDGDPATPDAPDVVNASWAMADPGCDLEFQPDLQALRAAGILSVFAAGNYGPNPGTSPSPANYPEALAVGATDNAATIYQYSSRGPSGCGETQTTFPEVVAPGVDIRTSDLYGGYSATSGTSMAAPHLAGVLALLLSANPDLSAGEQQAALTGTAVDLGAPGPDNDYGYGRVDALAAYNAIPKPPQDTVPPVITADPPPGTYDGAISVSLSSDEGERIHYTTDGSAPDDNSPLYDAPITVDSSRTIRATATDAAGNRAESSFLYTLRQPVSLALSASPTRINSGHPTTLSGTLSSRGGPLPGMPVVVEERPAGDPAATFTELQTLTTGSDGGFSLTDARPESNTDYRVRFDGSAELQTAASQPIRVGVRALVSESVPVSTLRPGGVLIVTGSVRPEHSGFPVELLIRRNGALISRHTVILDGRSRYRSTYRPKSAGSYSVRAVLPAHADHLRSLSPPRSFKVVPLAG